MQIEGIVKYQDEVIAPLSKENELFKSKLMSIEKLVPNQSQSDQNNNTVLVNTISAVHECNSELSSSTNLNTSDHESMNILSDIPLVLINHFDLITHDHSKENQPVVNCDQTSISPEKSREINFDVSIAACAEDVPTPTVLEINEVPTPPAAPNFEEVPSAKSQQTNSHLKKKEIPCLFIVRRGWYIKGDQCDFSHSNLPVINNLELRKAVKQKSAVFCPFLRKKGYCLKESRCDFSHRTLQQRQPPSFFGNRQQNNITSLLNRLEMRLQNIEYAQIPHALYPCCPPPQPMYQSFRRVHPSPLMETSVYAPQYPRFS